MPKIQCFVISISNPILIGIYQDYEIIQTIKVDGKTTEVLPLQFEEILKKYTIDEIFYVNGPGSYMAIKVAYVFLKSISVIKKIPLKACDGFEFNQNSPIKALGKKYFIKKDDEITIQNIDSSDILKDFELPKKLDINLFSEDSLPNYQLPAV
jgi:tRNA A37 threonylcarbamoyladenosine modification protein TsaB